MTNTVVAKFAVAFVAVAMAFSAIAPVAKAADVSTMSLDELIALVTQLQSQLGQSGSTGSTSGSCEMIPAPLTMGNEGAAVTALQNRLMADGQSIPAGATGYFGGQTQSALAAWQAAHGVTPAVGYYGPITKAAMDASCTPVDNGGDDNGSTDNGSSTTLSGEASLDDVTIDSADDDQIEEGAEDVVIAVATFNFVDGDAEISRLDVNLDSGDSTDNWDVLDEVSVWVDGDRIAKADASDKDSYQSDDKTLRFSGLDIVAMEDEDMEVEIRASIQNNVDSNDMDTFSVSVDSVRYFDADGVAETDSSTGDLGATVTFDVVAAGSNDQIVVKTSSEDPDAATLEVNDDSKSDWYSVFAFDLDTKDSVNDLDINELQVTVTTSVDFDTLVDDYELVVDGTTIDSLVDNNGLTAGKYTSGTTTTLTFDVDGDVTVDAGDRITAELRLRFNSLAPANEGATVQAAVTSTDRDAIDAEGADNVTDLTGAATGDTHTLRTTGADVSPASDSAVVTTGDQAGDDYATFEIEVDVTAFGQDVFVSTNQATSVAVTVVDGAGATVTGTSTVVLDSSADVEGGSFKIAEGETESLTITVTFDAATAGAAARLQLGSLVFGATDGANDQTWSALPATDYRTDIVTLVN